jgi:ribosomal protein L13
MMIIYDELKNDHDAVKEMMTRIEEMSSRASTSKVKLFEEMKTALTAHLRAEEKVFYDAIKREKTAHDAALEGYEEHHLADLLMREISRLAPSDEKWKAKFTVLKENVEHHEEEEGAKAREILDEAKAQELGEAFVAEKGKLLAKAA